jgi:hypothetical protein
MFGDHWHVAYISIAEIKARFSLSLKDNLSDVTVPFPFFNVIQD